MRPALLQFEVRPFDVAGASEGRAIEALFSARARSPRCNAGHPHLAENLVRLVKRQSAKPVSITVTSSTTHKKQRVMLDGTSFASILYLCLFPTGCFPSVPDVIFRTSRKYTPASWLSVTGGIIGGLVNWGMHLSIECAEDAVYTTPQ